MSWITITHELDYGTRFEIRDMRYFKVSQRNMRYFEENAFQ